MPRFLKSVILFAICCLFAASSALADEAAGDEKPGVDADLKNIVDANQDGQITDAEARRATAELQKQAAKRKDERAAAILNALDRDKNGKVDNAEAEQAVAEQRQLHDEIGQKVGAMFDKLDLDSNSTLDVREFRSLIDKLGVLGKLLEPKLGQFFNAMDANRDGQITNVESQFAADYFAQQVQIRRERDAAQENAKLVAIVRQTMAALDGNRNGKISIREAGKNKDLTTIFGIVDADDNKNLTPEEIYEYLKRQEDAKE